MLFSLVFNSSDCFLCLFSNNSLRHCTSDRLCLSSNISSLSLTISLLFASFALFNESSLFWLALSWAARELFSYLSLRIDLCFSFSSAATASRSALIFFPMSSNKAFGWLMIFILLISFALWYSFVTLSIQVPYIFLSSTSLSCYSLNSENNLLS